MEPTFVSPPGKPERFLMPESIGEGLNGFVLRDENSG